MVWTPPQNGRQSLAKSNLTVDTARQEKKRKTATIMEEPSDGLHEKKKLGRRYGRGQTSLAFGSIWTAFGCIDPNNNNNNDNNNDSIVLMYCIEGVVIAVQCTATFSRFIVLLLIQVLLGREYGD